MRKARVLLVDDSAAVRALVARVVESDAALEVAGTAPNGRIALAKLAHLDADVVVLDVMMDGMDGLETLVAIRERHPDLPVVMFSPLTAPGTATAVEALFLGANECIVKPNGARDLSQALDQVREELVPTLKALCASVLGNPLGGSPRRSTRSAHVAGTPRGRAPVDVVAIGVSTGGPLALAAVLGRLPATFPVPILVVQHMPPAFTALLATRLGQQSPLTVAEAVPGRAPQPGEVWLAPGDHHLSVRSEEGQPRLVVDQEERENSCRPSVDVLFRSVTAVYGAGTLALVLTGMGRDGLRGCENVRADGGQILVQDEASSVVWGMPGAVARAGLADAVVPLDSVAAELVRRVHRRPGRVPAAGGRSKTWG